MNRNHSPTVYNLVLNWNGAAETLDCLRSLERQSYANQESIVIDNGSIDDSVATIRAAFPSVTIIRNEENLGFAAGINVGVRFALEQGADYILILNNDLVLAEECVAEMVTHMGPDTGLVTAALYFADDRDRLWSIGGHISPFTLEKTADARGQLDSGHLPRVMDRTFVPGGATMISRAVFERIGLYDERFFLYYEDADYSLSASRAGIKAAVATRARMWHSVSKSSGGSDTPRERYWMARSSVLYFHKNARMWQWPIIITWRTLSALRTSLRLLAKGRNESLSAYWRGLRDGIAAARSLPRK